MSDLFNKAETPNPLFSAEWVFSCLNHQGRRAFPVTLIVRDGELTSSPPSGHAQTSEPATG